MHPALQHLGTIIREARSRLGLSQRQLAERAGLRVCSKSPTRPSSALDACIGRDRGASPQSAGGASTESC